MSNKFLQSVVGRGLREAGTILKQEGGVEVSKISLGRKKLRTIVCLPSVWSPSLELFPLLV